MLALRIDGEPLSLCEVSLRISPCREELTGRTGWHGGHSRSIQFTTYVDDSSLHMV